MAGETSPYTEKEFKSTTRRLKLGIGLGITLIAGEALAGGLAKSLALISDAGHNAADILAVCLSLFAVYMMVREPTPRRTYGYGRVGILTALANSAGLIAVSAILVYEAIRRIQHIHPVSGTTVLVVGFAAMAINTIIASTLFHHRHDLNIRSAFLHQVADAGVSLGVIVAGIIIIFTKWYYADPVIALIISIFIFRAAYALIRDATDVLLESVPRNIDLTRVQETIESIPGVEAVHHLHVWELGSGVYALSGHIEVEDKQVSACSSILEDVNVLLQENFNIVHPTIQIECATACPTAAAPPPAAEHEHEH
jgi:cobalt-zinc-cadmium efflux system protein